MFLCQLLEVFHRHFKCHIYFHFTILGQPAPSLFALLNIWSSYALYLDYGRHGLFHDFPLERHLKRERKLKMNSFNLNGKTFQIDLYRNYNQSGSILCGDKCVSMNFPSPPGGSTENLFKKILPISQVRTGVFV